VCNYRARAQSLGTQNALVRGVIGEERMFRSDASFKLLTERRLRGMPGTSGTHGLPLGVIVTQAIDLDRYLPYRIHQLAALIASPRLGGPAESAKLSVRGWRLMMVLAHRGPLSMTDAAQAIAADLASTNRTVQAMIAAGLLVGRTSPADRRKLIVTLTQAGADLHDAVARERLADEQRLMSALSEEERSALLAALDKLALRAAELQGSEDDPSRAFD
jgi:DNA-binding MarR family transcriptional regulator